MKMIFVVEVRMITGEWREIASFDDDYRANEYASLLLGARIGTTLR